MPDTMHTALDNLPARPGWIRAWAALHTRRVTYSLDAMRAASRMMSAAARDLQRTYPMDSVIRCDCGARDCQGTVLVAGYIDCDDGALLLVRRGPKADPYATRAQGFAVLHRGGNLTPEQVDVLASAPLGVC